MIFFEASRPEAVICSILVWVFAGYVFYWIIRLAVRHALNDAGFRSAVNTPRDDVPNSPPDSNGDESQRPWA